MTTKETKTEPNRCTSYPNGHYTTGCMDLMVGKREDGCLFRIFYPSTLSSIDENHDKWTKWYLGTQYSKGLGKFFMPFKLHSPYQVVADLLTKNTLTPAVWEAPVAEGRFPLVIFSHGLAANRSLYSSICNDLASHGFIVAAIEHRDRSACATFLIDENGKEEWILLKKKFPKNEFDARYKQVTIRAQECSSGLDIMKSLDSGNTLKNELKSQFSLSSFEGKIDTSQSILAGHSFGGATTILALSRDKRFSAGICLDPWLFPLDDFSRNKHTLSEAEINDLKSLSQRVQQPLLFILMECFQDKKNIQAMKKYERIGNEFWTLMKALHQNQTDTPIMFKNKILRMIVGCDSVIQPDTAMVLNNYLMVNFICKSLNKEQAYNKDYKTYIFKNNRWAIEGAEGSAKHMPGWHRKIINII